MIVQLIRMTAIALADATLGANAQLATLPLDATAAGVTDIRPANIVSVRNQADHNVDVEESLGENQYPLIAVCAKEPFTGAGQVWTSVQDSEGDIYCVVVVREGAPALNFLNGDYYLRAMKKAVHAYLLSSPTRDANGKRNNIAIMSSPKMDHSSATGSFMGGQAAGMLKITFKVRDQNP